MKLRANSRLVSVLGASIIFFGLTTSAMAVSLGFGIAGGATHIQVAGTETMKENSTKTSDKGHYQELIEIYNAHKNGENPISIESLIETSYVSIQLRSM